MMNGKVQICGDAYRVPKPGRMVGMRNDQGLIGKHIRVW